MAKVKSSNQAQVASNLTCGGVDSCKIDDIFRSKRNRPERYDHTLKNSTSSKNVGAGKCKSFNIKAKSSAADIHDGKKKIRISNKSQSIQSNSTNSRNQTRALPGLKKKKVKLSKVKENVITQYYKRFLKEIILDGRKYKVGDSAYVNVEESELTEEFENCEICLDSYKEINGQEIPMLECDKCLRGFHLDCLNPALNEVPKIEWYCPSCVTGMDTTSADNLYGGARKLLLNGKWSLAKIVSLWQEKDGSYSFQAQWYMLPEETHTGRQKHHGAREVFLSDVIDNNPALSLDRVVQVCLSSQGQQYIDNSDVYICEYEYDTTHKRFRRISDELAELTAPWDDSDDMAENADSDSDFDGSSISKPVYSYWVEKGLISAKNMRQKLKSIHTHNCGPKLKPKKAQGGLLKGQSDLFSLGLSQIPENVRSIKLTDLAKARMALMPNSTESLLPGRESERNDILTFIKETISTEQHNAGKCLYVYGVPGTGKTASVMAIVSYLQTEVSNGKFPNFHFIDINSLKLPSPQHAYTFLFEALTGQHLSPTTAFVHLDEYFNKPIQQEKKITVVLLLDELDFLITRNHQVLYNLLEWPTKSGNNLIVIAIANTMNLPERLPARIASRLGSQRIVFQPYNKNQLSNIVQKKLSAADVSHTFSSNAINLACSKVAGVSGDVRRLLQLCSKATELCENEGLIQVAMKHINSASEEMFSAIHIQILSDCCRLEKLILAFMLVSMRITGRLESILQDVTLRLQQTVQLYDCPIPSIRDCIACANRLASKRLILTETGKDMHMHISLNVPQDEVRDLLLDSHEVPWLSKLSF